MYMKLSASSLSIAIPNLDFTFNASTNCWIQINISGLIYLYEISDFLSLGPSGTLGATSCKLDWFEINPPFEETSFMTMDGSLCQIELSNLVLSSGKVDFKFFLIDENDGNAYKAIERFHIDAWGWLPGSYKIRGKLNLRKKTCGFQRIKIVDPKYVHTVKIK